MKGDRAFLLMDANVLIDFCKSDASVLALVSSEIGTVHIPRPLLEEEVENLQREDWTTLGVVPVRKSDRVWRETWRGAKQLPRTVRVSVRDAATSRTLAMSTSTFVHAEIPARCTWPGSGGGCSRPGSGNAGGSGRIARAARGRRACGAGWPAAQ